MKKKKITVMLIILIMTMVSIISAESFKIESIEFQKVSQEKTINIPNQIQKIDARIGFSSMILTWDRPVYAMGYSVQMLNGNVWTVIKTTYNSADLTASVMNLKEGKTYNFRIFPFAKSGSKIYWGNPTYAQFDTKAKVAPEALGEISSKIGWQSVILNWNAPKDASGYSVQMFVGGKWKVVKTTYNANDTTATISHLNSATTYDFRIFPFAKYGDVIKWGKQSYEKITTMGKVTPGKLGTISTTVGYYSAILSWNKTPNATGYSVQAYDGKSWVVVANKFIATDTKIVFNNLLSGKNYSFRIFPFTKDGGKILWGEQSYAKFQTKTDHIVKMKAYSCTSSSVTLNWTAIAGVQGYRVYAYKDGKYVALKTIFSNKTTSYTIGNLSPDNKFYYKVRAFSKVDDTVTWYSPSALFAAKTRPQTAQISASASTTNSIKISWKKPVGATGYNVYMYKGGKWQVVNTIKDANTTSYYVNKLSTNTKYHFAVKSFSTKYSPTTWGLMSKIYTVQTKAVAPDLSSYKDLWVPKPTKVVTPKAKTVYLTFDDGPSERTIEILDILKKYNVKATFFVCAQVPSQRTDSAISILKRIVAEGHTIGIHSYSHEYSDIYSSVSAYLKDFSKMYDFVVKNTGYKPTVYRFPGGSNTGYNSSTRASIIKEMNKRGFVYYDWNCQNGDATGISYSASQLANNAIKSLKSNGYTIVLMHDFSTKRNTPASVQSIISYAKSNGYTFDKLDNSIKPIQFAKY